MRFSISLLRALLALPLSPFACSGISMALERGDPASGKKVFAKYQACQPVPGTKLAFLGQPKPTDRADIFAYLEQTAGTSP